MNKNTNVDKEFVDNFLSSVHADDLSTGPKIDVALIIIFVNVRIGWRKVVLKYRFDTTGLEQMVNKKYRMLTEEHKCLMENKI